VLWANYQKLKTNIVPVAPEEKEFKLVSKYLRQTHAPSHSQYSLELLDLFKIDREGEMTRYEKWAKLHNRMVHVRVVCVSCVVMSGLTNRSPRWQLLWHGSRLTNWAGILSQGLRIAPPEAPSTGYMVRSSHSATCMSPPHKGQSAHGVGVVSDSSARESTLRTWRASRPTTASHRARTMWAS
jgi:hypothetical protein